MLKRNIHFRLECSQNTYNMILCLQICFHNSYYLELPLYSLYYYFIYPSSSSMQTRFLDNAATAARATIFYWFNSLIPLQVASCNQPNSKFTLFRIPPCLFYFSSGDVPEISIFTRVMHYCRMDYAEVADCWENGIVWIQNMI